jgi:hypothetical protein
MLQYLVVLAGTDPLVWRRIRIPATYSFWDLHVAVQDAMGWLDYHLHQFRVLDPRSGTTMLIGIPDDEVPDDRSVVAGWREFPLDYMVGDAPPMHYLYDFGDDWQHALLFEGSSRETSGERSRSVSPVPGLVRLRTQEELTITRCSSRRPQTLLTRTMNMPWQSSEAYRIRIHSQSMTFAFTTRRRGGALRLTRVRANTELDLTLR